MQKNIHAYTEMTLPNPGYLSINARDDGTAWATIRATGSQTPVEIELSREQLEAMVKDISNYLTL